MAEQCKSCGAGLFIGQQFCRLCGAPTAALPGGEMPTQILSPETHPNAPETSGQRHNAPGTDLFFPAAPTGNYYQPPGMPPPAAPTSALARRRSPRRWIIALAVIGLMGTATLAALLVAISMRRQSDVSQARAVKLPVPKIGKIDRTVPPPPPPGAPLGGIVPTAEIEGEPLDEEGADISGDKTTIARSFPLKEGATLSLRNLSGDIKIEGWDEANAEVTIVKRGGSEDERRRARIMSSDEGNRLTLATSPHAMTGKVQVDYHIRLPRGVKHLEIASLNSEVEVSNIAGSVALNIQSGEINLENIGGVLRTQLVKGKTTIVLGDRTPAGREPYNIGAVNGDVELIIEPDIDMDIKAEVVEGEIEPDDDFGFQVTERPIGKRLVGRMGAGGKPVVIKVVNGTIKIKK